MNSKHKNIIIAAMAAGIFYTKIVAGIPEDKIIIAVVCIFLGAIAVMEVFDGIDELRYESKKYLSKFYFNNYKKKIQRQVEEKRTKGKDEAWIKNFILNSMIFDKRLAFSGKQIGELLKLATDTERSV